GLAVGYAAGARHAGKPPSPPRPAASQTALSFSAGGFPLSQTGPCCSAQIGHELQLGLEVTNLSATAITLRRVEVMPPVGRVKAASPSWGPRGQFPSVIKAPPPGLGPGGGG